MNIDLNDYVSGGYYITKYARRDWPDHPRTPDLLPDKLVSLSQCVSSVLEVMWAWNLDRNDKLNLKRTTDFGIPLEMLEEFTAWATDNYPHNWEWPGIFTSPQTPGQFVAQFFSAASDILIIGIGLHRELIDEFWENVSTDGEPYHGLEQTLHGDKSLVSGGEILGFEVVSCFHHSFAHSWLCSGLQRDMLDIFGIRPNAHGLISTYEEARKIYDWIAEDEQRGHRGEPEPYFPWLIVKYPLATASNN